MSPRGELVAETRSLARSTAGLTLDLVDRIPVVGARLVAGLQRRARGAGVPEVLIDHSDRIATRFGVRTAVAELRLLVQVAEGDVDALTPLLHKFEEPRDPALMWAALRLAGYDVAELDLASDPERILDALEPEIRRGFTRFGYSTVFEWLLDNDRLPADRTRLEPLVVALIDTMADRLRSIEAPEDPLALDDLTAAAGLLAADTRVGAELIVWGPSVLRIAAPDRTFPRHGGMEFATSTDLDELLPRLPGEIDVIDRDPGGAELWIGPIARTARIATLRRTSEGGVEQLDHGWVRRHGSGDATQRSLPLREPVDIETHLTERFGRWRDEQLLFHPVLDSPNTSIAPSLDGLCALTDHVATTFELGVRREADRYSDDLRDTFGVDYSMYTPRRPHRKVLATPLLHHEVDGRPIVAVVGRFDRLDAPLLSRLGDVVARSDEELGTRPLVVAGVLAGPASDERVTDVRGLRVVDHAVVVEDADRLDDVLPARPHHVVPLDDGDGTT